MSNVTIYHNPRCTKSRQTLALLRENDIEPEIIEYLKEPPDADALRSVVKKTGLAATEMVRRKEFLELNVNEPADDETWIGLMAAYPQIIERPIVVAGDKAALGRPPENVLSILPPG